MKSRRHCPNCKEEMIFTGHSNTTYSKYNCEVCDSVWLIQWKERLKR